ncbi:MAG TPA: GNAT family N-acetyltransferase [Planctomycetaceae bacterium]|jgi:CelD/BcsL family acetyltransferase involved in cellulose biosynthesis|nr:GNAT family N-acetyltransferase [Planctomycetaceae bacterium]
MSLLTELQKASDAVTVTLTPRPAGITATTAATPLTLEVCAPEQRATVMAHWKSLEATLAPVALSCTYDWVDAWLNHYGDQIPHQFVVARRGSILRAVLLLTADLTDRQAMLRINTWHFGTAGELDCDSVCVEYNDWLCAPEEREAVLEALVTSTDARLACDRWQFDGVAAIDLPDTVSSANDWRCDRRVARYLDLHEIRESRRELITFFGDSTRKHIRQNLRDYGQVDVEWTDTVSAAHAVFDEQIALHQQRWRSVGEPGCYSSAVFTAFHRELIDRLVPKQLMTVVGVRAGGQTLGCSQLLFDRNRVLVYQGGRNPNAGKLSPGLITDYQCMLECLRRGYDAFDFMAGDSLHKQRMTTHTAPLVWAEKRQPGWKLPLLDAVQKCRQTLRSWLGRHAAAHPSLMGSKED